MKAYTLGNVLFACLITAFVMHVLTVYILIVHKERAMAHVQSLANATSGAREYLFRNHGRLPTKTTIVTTPKDFDDVFGIATGVEAIEESYSPLLQRRR